MSHNNLNSLVTHLNIELCKVHSWLISNRLILNSSKSHMMIFTKRKVNLDDVKIFINTCEIKRVRVTKFLGVMLDEALTWNNHIDGVCSKVARCIGVLNKLNFLPSHILKSLYFTLLHPHLNYCNVIWASSSVNNLMRLHRFQKKAVRIMCNLHFCAPTSLSFQKLKILNIFDMYKFNVACFMYSCHKKLLPLSLRKFVCINSEKHDRFTRRTNNFYVPYVRTTVSQRSNAFSGPQLWNSLSVSLKNAPSVKSFKKYYKLLLLDSYGI